MHNANLITGIKNGFEDKIIAEISNSNSDLKQSTLNGLYLRSKQAALQQVFTADKVFQNKLSRTDLERKLCMFLTELIIAISTNFVLQINPGSIKPI